MPYTKANVQMHSDGYRPANPAVNVKVHDSPSIREVVYKFGCSEKVAERALEWAFKIGAQSFWDSAQERADFVLKEGKVYSEGRSEGWLVVHDLPDLETWDAIMLCKWQRFEKECKVEIKYLCSSEKVLEDIESNRWAEENAEEWNFFDRGEETVCLSDVPRCDHCRKAT